MTWTWIVYFVNALIPEMILMIGACLVLFIGPCDRRTRAISSIFTLGIIGSAVLVTLTLGTKALTTAEFTRFSGLACGPLTLYVRMLTLAVGGLLVAANWYQPDDDERNEYFSMLLLSMAGVNLVALSNDLVLLFFALELVSVPTYVMVALSRRDIRAQEAGSKYFFLGAMSAALLAYGLSFLFGATGTTTLFGENSIGSWLAMGSLDGYALIGLLITLGALCFKIAAVPFHGYVADVYEGAGAPLAGALAFLPKLAGLLGMIHMLNLIAWQMPAALFWTLWTIAAATMTAGNVLALMQSNVKRMLAYSSVAHSGYMLIGLAVGPRINAGPFADGLAALLFYMAIYGVMNLGAFAFITCLSSEDHEAAEPSHFKGCARRQPLAAAGLTVCMFSLIGLPLTSGFMGKVYLFAGAFSAGDGPYGKGLMALAIVGGVNSAIGAAYYLRVVGWCWFESPAATEPQDSRGVARAVLAVCALLTLAVFIWPQGLHRAAEQASAGVRTPPAVRSAALAPTAHSAPGRPQQ